jgi:bleomycin hydrolase
MKKTINLLLISFLLVSVLPGLTHAQENEKEYQFTDKIRLETTSVKDQGKSGTCWCFATVSFLETELIRMGKPEYDLSEMFLVHHAYEKKARKYIRYHGNNNFGQVGQAHDAMIELSQHGIVPEEVYSGIIYGDDNTHRHYEMASVLKSMVKTLVKNRRSKLSPVWDEAYGSILDSYMGVPPKEFKYKGENYTPQSFAENLGINPNDYVELTSFSHHPFYESVILEVPDNWSHDPYYNVPLDELMEIMDYSIEEGYSVVWDGDVSSEGFSHRSGIAVLPENEDDNFKMHPVTEKSIDQEYRQKMFNNFTMTDDHLMHLTGIGEDQNGQKYYLTKNSWDSDSNEYGGYLYMSDPYVRLNTIAIMVHKEAIPDEIAEKLGIE